MSGCHCLCFAAHLETACDPGAPAALVLVDTRDSMLHTAMGITEHVVQMCLPCAEAAQRENPRFRSMVLAPEIAP